MSGGSADLMHLPAPADAPHWTGNVKEPGIAAVRCRDQTSAWLSQHQRVWHRQIAQLLAIGA